MISFDEAKNIVRSNVQPLPPLSVPLQEAAGLVVAEDIHSPIDVPAFDQSAMDGYAFCFQNFKQNDRLLLNGIVPAGSHRTDLQQAHQAVRIFTGAPVPWGADTVAIQEKVMVQSNELIINDAALQRGSNVRQRGSEIKTGARALKGKTKLSPAAIGYLASLGYSEVVVYPKPSVAIIITGNELQQPGRTLQAGQVYESNSFALRAALQQIGVTNITVTMVVDDMHRIEEALLDALQNNNVVLLTGGISVGDYDYVLKATAACGVIQLFHQVRQKPGKPLYCGKMENKLVFGLPGNPFAVLACFYEFVVPALEVLAQQKDTLETIYLTLTAPFTKKSGYTYLLKGWYEEHKVSLLPAQESYRLSSFAIANCLVCLDENVSEYKAGDLVEVHRLPF